MEAGDEIRYLNEQFKPALADFLDAKGDLDGLPLQLSTVLQSIAASVRANEDLLFNTSDAGNLIAQASVQVKQLFEDNLELRNQYPAALQRLDSLFRILDTVKDIQNPDILQITFEAGGSAADALDEAPWNF